MEGEGGGRNKNMENVPEWVRWGAMSSLSVDLLCIRRFGCLALVSEREELGQCVGEDGQRRVPRTGGEVGGHLARGRGKSQVARQDRRGGPLVFTPLFFCR